MRLAVHGGPDLPAPGAGPGVPARDQPPAQLRAHQHPDGQLQDAPLPGQGQGGQGSGGHRLSLLRARHCAPLRPGHQGEGYILPIILNASPKRSIKYTFKKMFSVCISLNLFVSCKKYMQRKEESVIDQMT